MSNGRLKKIFKTIYAEPSYEDESFELTMNLNTIMNVYRKCKNGTASQAESISLDYMITSLDWVSNNGSFAKRRDAKIGKMILEFYKIVCKSVIDWRDDKPIGSGGKICITELKDVTGYRDTLLPSTFQSQIAKDHTSQGSTCNISEIKSVSVRII